MEEEERWVDKIGRDLMGWRDKEQVVRRQAPSGC